MKRNQSRNDAFWAVVTQFMVVIILSLITGFVWQARAGGSFFIGGLVCVLPNVYLYWQVFSYSGARAAKQIIKALYLGECVKLLLTAVGFAGALMISWMLPMWLFVGFIVAQMGFWLAPIILSSLRAAKFFNNNK